MSRYINADKVLDDIKDLDETEFADGTIFREEAIWFIKNAPTVDVQEVKHGHWIDTTAYCGEFTCSVCKETCVTNKYKYCPYCGTKMDE